MVQFHKLQLVCIAGYCLNCSFKIGGISHADRPIAGWRIYKAYQHFIHALQVDSLIPSNFIIHNTIYLTANGHNATL